MLMPPYGKTIDVTEGAGISDYTKRKLKPNFDYRKAGPGFYLLALSPEAKFGYNCFWIFHCETQSLLVGVYGF